MLRFCEAQTPQAPDAPCPDPIMGWGYPNPPSRICSCPSSKQDNSKFLLVTALEFLLGEIKAVRQEPSQEPGCG